MYARSSPVRFWVDRHVHQPAARAREEADQVRVRVVAVGTDTVARRQSRGAQHLGRAGDGLVEFGVGPGPVAVVDRDAFGVRRALRRSTPSTVMLRPAATVGF